MREFENLKMELLLTYYCKQKKQTSRVENQLNKILLNNEFYILTSDF
jgi:hypothetical protein